AAVSGEQQEFLQEYPCHSPTEQRWFIARITSFGSPDARRVVIAHINITQRKQTENKMIRSEAFLNTVLQNLPIGVFIKDATDRRFVLWNRDNERIHGMKAEAVIGKSDHDFFSQKEADGFAAKDTEVLQRGEMVDVPAEMVDSPAQGRLVLHTRKLPILGADGKPAYLLGISEDITRRQHVEAMLAGERLTLEMIASGQPTRVILEAVARSTEELGKGMLCSILLLDEDGTRLHLGAAPSLPEAYNRAIEGVVIGPEVGSCGTAAYRNETVIVSDISIDPLWKNFKELALAHGLRACWSRPIRSGAGAVIGTFAIYYREPRAPQPAELELIERLANQAGIAIERMRAAAELEKAQKNLLTSTRMAGMAEVATSVLHNVGNVLNSVNVSATVIADKVRKSKTPTLARVCGLLREHNSDLGNYLTVDPKGRQVPSFLESLAEHLAAEQASIQQEVGSLAKNIEHIKDIVATQQSYAKGTTMIEDLTPAELLEDALHMNLGSISQHQIDLVRQIPADLPFVRVDKHKTLQILVNLIRNAKHACEDSGRPEKRIIIRAKRHGDRVWLQVADTGVGIPAENLTRIFNHGFTTKKDGHGFGLHSAANAAKEMGGALTVASAGPGCGATFTLELPSPTEPACRAA
ncbi:MAG: GAF domain-containing protein, partial [Opitutaceae bacterium]